MKKSSLAGNCRYNIGIECDNRSMCDKCGWNPKVEKERKEKLREKEEAEDEKKRN